MFVTKLPVTEKIQFYRLNFNGGVQILKLYEMEYLLMIQNLIKSSATKNVELN